MQKGKNCCVEHPDAETKETYRLRVLLRQGGINMWVTAFDEVEESILGVSAVQRSRIRQKEESCLGSEWNEMVHDR